MSGGRTSDLLVALVPQGRCPGWVVLRPSVAPAGGGSLQGRVAPLPVDVSRLRSPVRRIGAFVNHPGPQPQEEP